MEIYNTTWWGNAIDTAITAGTEPDFFGSQMKMLTSQQPEEVINGDFATDTDWAKATGWTISGGTANANTSGNYINFYQNNVFTIGKSYKYEFTILNYSQGEVRFTQGGLDISGVKNANGTYTGVFLASQTSLYFQGVNSFIGSIDNVSVKLARAEEVEAVKCLADWIHTTALQDLNN